MTRTTILRIGPLACLAVFAAAIYLHSQLALVGSVLVAFLIGIVAIWSGVRIQRAAPRQRLRELAEEYLEAGEVFQATFMAMSGPGPYLIMIAFVFTIPLTVLVGPAAQALVLSLAWFTTVWAIVVTDRAILLFKKNRDPEAEAYVLQARLPRHTRFGPASGWWTMIHLNGTDMFVLRRYRADIELADRLIDAEPTVESATPRIEHPGGH
jgi:hypothetical protein